ncbi:hypothetical protein [Mycobacterium sp. BK086]|uniref:hypothetical protein n=1 Tax=Mycobacterium sp. BK086 TaxID=2512165 RepID=UPI00141525BA|nr:hypothetical protein [Mycobacterium sp. BK086]
MKLRFYVFLWPRPGMEQALIAYEDAVLELVGEHERISLTRGCDSRTFIAKGHGTRLRLREAASPQ